MCQLPQESPYWQAEGRIIVRDRLMVGRNSLKVVILVRIQVPQQNSETDRKALFYNVFWKILVRDREASKIQNVHELAKIPSATKIFLLSS